MEKLHKTAVTITTNLAPLWDARNDLHNLTGILGAVLYLSGGQNSILSPEDPAKEDIITALVQVQETVARCAEALHDAIKEGQVSEVTQVTANI